MDVVTFAFEEQPLSLAASLRAAEPQAPKQMKTLLIQAAEHIDHLSPVLREVVASLDEAAQLRVGAMDSDSRAQEISTSQTQAIRQAADRLRHLITP